MEEVREIKGSGSSRKYFRVSGEEGSFIRVEGTDLLENRAFITLARHFKSKGINVPEVLEVSPDMMSYTLEDLGSDSLYSLVGKGRTEGSYSPEEEELLLKAIAQLPRIQFIGAQDLDYSVCFPDKEFNGRMVDFDLNYFKYCFLKTSGITFNEIKLQDDFDALKEDLLEDIGNTFMYRDFQARNIMIKDGEPYFIDFQGGRRGPVYYDAASFIWQASARYPSDLKTRLTDAYYTALSRYEKVDRTFFDKKMRIFVLFRTLQVLGAYGFRGRFERKPYFIASIPHALDNIAELIKTPFYRYPYLNGILEKLVQQRDGRAPEMEPTLNVIVQSFSYKEGLPVDNSGHGGGYIFDCRSLHNPGRYPEYRNLCGKDKPVTDFLEQCGEVQPFLENIYAIIDPHVEKYLERGFNHLQVNFGCTGGRHRSVYCAEALAKHLKEKFSGIRVTLSHTALPE